MKARRRIESASYGPQTLERLGKAFDSAWEDIAPSVGTRPQAIEAARMKLADIILNLASNGQQDADQLKEAALKIMFKPPHEL
jgi:hypothetical protein